MNTLVNVCASACFAALLLVQMLTGLYSRSAQNNLPKITVLVFCTLFCTLAFSCIALDQGILYRADGTVFEWYSFLASAVCEIVLVTTFIDWYAVAVAPPLLCYLAFHLFSPRTMLETLYYYFTASNGIMAESSERTIIALLVVAGCVWSRHEWVAFVVGAIFLRHIFVALFATVVVAPLVPRILGPIFMGNKLSLRHASVIMIYTMLLWMHELTRFFVPSIHPIVLTMLHFNANFAAIGLLWYESISQAGVPVKSVK